MNGRKCRLGAEVNDARILYPFYSGCEVISLAEFSKYQGSIQRFAGNVKLNMPTVLREGPYRFFYSNDRDEPLHMHIERDDRVVKFRLEPVEMQASGGLSQRDLKRIENIINRRLDLLIGAWNDYFND